LEKVFTRMREANLTLKPSKCEYLQEQVRILGYTVSGENIYPEEGKLAGIKEFPTPKKTKELQSFLGLYNFSRKFIKSSFIVIARPLHEATKKNKFRWEKEKEEAFQELKNRLTTAPVLKRYNPNIGCTLHTDACTESIGAILLHEGEDKQNHPIAYISRSLSKAEKNYSISELELLATV